ncbi:hypothetical protein [Streptomyces sp. N35]|uniref:hypothetical protein n=1 Tax=Streptomyces sp. N35 TaxID=2795730 RepID=UPI0018F7A32C|nr:hypothetical protein [Streptomyces sp. N35]
MDTVTRAHWEEAALRLLDDVYAFAATGPRRHLDWRDDASALLRHEVGDPRGWLVIDSESDRAARDAHCPSFPFVQASSGALAERLYPVDRATAERLLVVMTYEWGPVPPQDAPQACADARTLLSRYGDELSFHSNVTAARSTQTPDLTRGFTGWSPLTQYAGDVGLVVVGAQEIGVFWSFDPS